MNKVQILYPVDKDRNLHEFFCQEAKAMKNAGFLVSTQILDEADSIIYRGFTIANASEYPDDSRMLQSWNANCRTLLMNEFVPHIHELTMDTFFVDSIEDSELPKRILAKGWKKAFIKASWKSLFCIDDDASVWPIHTFEWMKSEFDRRKFSGPYAIREFIPDKEVFYNEQRYWVLNGHVYHPSGNIPHKVIEGARRLYDFSGSHYFTIDYAGDYIVEVNPGESSDRGGENPLDWFVGIFADEFLYH